MTLLLFSPILCGNFNANARCERLLEEYWNVRRSVGMYMCMCVIHISSRISISDWQETLAPSQLTDFYPLFRQISISDWWETLATFKLADTLFYVCSIHKMIGSMDSNMQIYAYQRISLKGRIMFNKEQERSPSWLLQRIAVHLGRRALRPRCWLHCEVFSFYYKPMELNHEIARNPYYVP